MREYDIGAQIKREKKILRLKKKGFTFEEIHGQTNGLSLRAIKQYYSTAMLRDKLETNGVYTKDLSSSLLVEINRIKSFPCQVELINKLHSGVFKNRNEFRIAKKKLEFNIIDDDSGADGADGAEYSNNLQTKNLNDIKTELKLITNYENLAGKVMILMRKDKLEKYSGKTQDFCLEIMKKLKNYLEEQLGVRRVINVIK